jgi:transcriptional regulator GlxA family with amidase domain
MLGLAAKASLRDAAAVREVVIVAFPEVQALDVAGPAEVFAQAGGYGVRVAAPRVEPLATGSGYAIAPEVALANVDLDRVDTLVVAGGEGTRAAVADEVLVAWLAAAAPRVRRVAAVCTGAFLLARAGLLDGRRATTHWAWCDELARRFPAVVVEPDPIFVADGPFRTSAGVTAGMDLALSLVEEDLGPRAALRVARELVLFVRRPGGQSQFSAGLAAQAAENAPLRELQAWISDHLDEDLSVPALARRAHMAERSFARAYARETGRTPAVHVELLRVERARMLLETTPAGVEAVAARCGFGTVETMRRAFARRLGVAPAAYRSRFAA